MSEPSALPQRTAQAPGFDSGRRIQGAMARMVLYRTLTVCRICFFVPFACVNVMRKV